MVRVVSVIVILCSFFSLRSQERFSTDGFLRATATFAVGSPLASASSHAYIKGELEYYVNENWSVRGDSYFKVGELAQKREFNDYHSTFAGLVYHWLKPESKIDLYTGLQPGINWSESLTIVGENTFASKRSLDPVISWLGGCNLYATHYFHAFVNLRYIQGYRDSSFAPYNLSELRFSFGLGFHIGTKRR
jgi:hypothetical protein